MITIPVEDFVFVVAALLGGVLLLITVVFDDILGSVLDAVGLDLGGTSVAPLLLGFIAMFGAGGLLSTQVFDIHDGQAALVATVFGVAGAGMAGGLFAWLRRSESAEPFSLHDLVGESAYVAVSIPAGRYGSVLVHAEGQSHEFAATASSEVPAGTTVQIVGVAGTGLIVTPEPASAATDGVAGVGPAAPSSTPPEPDGGSGAG
jgi:membrane protein implicated in regulation of membrane protease activity